MQEDLWDPNARFSLSVREITSVSATFILSADPSLSEFSWDEDEDDEASQAKDADAGDASKRVIPDALAKGLSVLVNGQPWQRVLMRLDDTADEAIIIIYGLMPGRKYDIELGVAPGDESIRGQVTTEQHTREFYASHLPGSGVVPSPNEQLYSDMKHAQMRIFLSLTETRPRRRKTRLLLGPRPLLHRLLRLLHQPCRLRWRSVRSSCSKHSLTSRTSDPL
jgi:hypothetical protein